VAEATGCAGFCCAAAGLGGARRGVCGCHGALTVVRRRDGCAAWHGHGDDWRAKRGRDAGRIGWLACPMGSGRRWVDAERVASCCSFRRYLLGCCALDDARHRGCAPWRGLHRRCTGSRRCRLLTTIGRACGGYRWAYGARRAASVAPTTSGPAKVCCLRACHRSVLT
jgi:hypothetical protein